MGYIFWWPLYLHHLCFSIYSSYLYINSSSLIVWKATLYNPWAFTNSHSLISFPVVEKFQWTIPLSTTTGKVSITIGRPTEPIYRCCITIITTLCMFSRWNRDTKNLTENLRCLFYSLPVDLRIQCTVYSQTQCLYLYMRLSYNYIQNFGTWTYSSTPSPTFFSSPSSWLMTSLGRKSTTRLLLGSFICHPLFFGIFREIPPHSTHL